MTQEEDLGQLVQRLVGRITAAQGNFEGLEEAGYSNIPRYGVIKDSLQDAARLVRELSNLLSGRGLISGMPQPNIENKVYRVVHVDDEGPLRSVVKDFLTSQEYRHPGRNVKYEVHSYPGVDEALSSITGLGQVDILITDRKMNGKTGFDLLDAISDPNNRLVRKPEYAGIKNLAMFASDDPEVAKLRNYGAAFIPKPINFGKFEDLVYSIITSRPQS